MTSPATRIQRLKRRYQTGQAFVSVQRARAYTQSYRETEGKGLSNSVRVALAMKHVYERCTHYVDPDDRIAGHWTERFLGVPVDIERGVFNQVLESELEKGTLIRSRVRSAARGLTYMLRKGDPLEFLRNQRRAKSAGASPMNLSLDTMSERAINPFQITASDRRELLCDLLPYWKGRTLVDRLARELAQAELYSSDMHEFAMALHGNTSRQVCMLSTCATIASIQGHVILDYDRVLELGLEAMTEEAREALAQTPERGREQDFLRSQVIALEGVTVFATRLAEAVARELDRTTDPERRAELARMHATCCKVPFQPPETFEAAVQALWTIKTAVELAHPVNLHCFGRLDQTLLPFYLRDLASGRTSPDEARELLEELLLKIMAQNVRPESNMLANFYHRYLGSSPVTVGGVDRDGNDATNELTFLFLQAAHGSKAITNLSVRIHAETPDALLDAVADGLQQGTSSYSLFNDATHIEAMRRRGFAEEDARDYAIMGCVEATCPGKTGSMSASALLLSRLLDITLRDGDSALLAGVVRGVGPKTGDPATFETFDDLLEALLEQARHAIETIVRGSNLRDRLYAEHLPAPLISAFMDGCLQSRRDVTDGGATYDMSGISMINSIANLVDSLYVIKRLVFEERRFTLRALLDAVNANFVGDEHASIRFAVDGLKGKWGNGNPEADALATDITQRLFDLTRPYRTHRDGPFVVYAISMITHTIDGRLSLATPDGRRLATPFAASCNPYNVERSGVTAALRSIAALPFKDVMGSAVNLKFHPTGIGETTETRSKWVSLIRTYFQLGGAQLQPTCVSAEVLLDAQRRPDAYRDLIVKVGGYSTYFVDLGREIQQEIIERTEHR